MSGTAPLHGRVRVLGYKQRHRIRPRVTMAEQKREGNQRKEISLGCMSRWIGMH